MKFKDDKSIYLQIADYFYESILKKEMKSGDRVPSVRDLAVETEVNPNTVMRTYQHLQDNDIIYNKRGIGYFITENAYQTTNNMKKEEFVKNTLPEFFKSLSMLEISLQEVEKLYEEYKQKNKK